MAHIGSSKTSLVLLERFNCLFCLGSSMSRHTHLPRSETPITLLTSLRTRRYILEGVNAPFAPLYLRLTMSTRLAACEPCRKSKLACDHQQPVCNRCRDGNRPGLCIYRSAPFKRRKTSNAVTENISSHQYGIPNPWHCSSIHRLRPCHFIRRYYC